MGISIITGLRGFDKEERTMWPFGMSRREMESFLRENSDGLISILLDAYGMTVDEIVTEHMSEEAQDWAGDYWEAC